MERALRAYYQAICFALLFISSGSSSKVEKPPLSEDLSLWIDSQQVKMYSGISMTIFAIVDGKVLPYILDPNFEKYLPTIPSEVGYVNFTWQSGVKKYFYNFDRLQSYDENILEAPIVSIPREGRIPRRAKGISRGIVPTVIKSVLLPCSGHGSGTASFGIGLLIQSRKGKPLPGTPLRVKMRKECMVRGPDVECDKKCANGGWCNSEKICQCPEGYMGQHCNTALCYPACMNNGTCTAPGICSCPPGYQGRHCEGGICFEKCLNGGKCVQKDTCDCSKGYYGLRCEFSKCIIPCLNGGRCKGVNKCRCPRGFRGDHCEIGQPTFNCSRPCRHGTCYANDVCVCDRGWTGKRCSQRKISSSEDLSIFDDEDDELPVNIHTSKKPKIFV